MHECVRFPCSRRSSPECLVRSNMPLCLTPSHIYNKRILLSVSSRGPLINQKVRQSAARPGRRAFTHSLSCSSLTFDLCKTTESARREKKTKTSSRALALARDSYTYFCSPLGVWRRGQNGLRHGYHKICLLTTTRSALLLHLTFDTAGRVFALTARGGSHCAFKLAISRGGSRQIVCSPTEPFFANLIQRELYILWNLNAIIITQHLAWSLSCSLVIQMLKKL